jgi:uncharacterized membrane protein YdbT with pleckstrin-like domain
VSEITIRPTTKFVKAGALSLLAVVLGADVAYLVWMRDSHDLGWAPLLLPVVLVWPLFRWLRLRFTRATISGDHLRYELGMAAKTTRTIQLSKVQDVTVHQSIPQRLFGVGDISIETAGETSRLTLFNVDDAQKVADEILGAAHQGTATL